MKLLDIYKPIRKVSYPLTSVFIVGGLIYFLLIPGFSIFGLLIVIAASALLLGIWLWLRPGRSDITNAEEVERIIANGRPTFLNVYSNY